MTTNSKKNYKRWVLPVVFWAERETKVKERSAEGALWSLPPQKVPAGQSAVLDCVKKVPEKHQKISPTRLIAPLPTPYSTPLVKIVLILWRRQTQRLSNEKRNLRPSRCGTLLWNQNIVCKNQSAAHSRYRYKSLRLSRIKQCYSWKANETNIDIHTYTIWMIRFASETMISPMWQAEMTTKINVPASCNTCGTTCRSSAASAPPSS